MSPASSCAHHTWTRSSRAGEGWLSAPSGMVCTGMRTSLPPQFGPNPQCSKQRQRNQQHDYGGREAHVEIAVGIIYGVMADQIPRQPREDNERCWCQKSEKPRG